MNDDAPLSDEKHAAKVELKSRPPSLRYECFGPNSTYLGIVNASLNASQVGSLLRVPRIHCKAIGFILYNLKGTHPSVFMHRILIDTLN